MPNLPHPILAAHQALVAKLAAIIPPRIWSDPAPEEFENVRDYEAACVRIFDEWHRMLGQELQANSTVRHDPAYFADAFRGATEGLSQFEFTRAADVLREDEAAAGRVLDAAE
jgi:hypothetical protein